MSQENVEIVRAALDAWSRNDWDAAFARVAADLELDLSRDLGEWRGVHNTPAELKRRWEEYAEAWESIQIEVGDVIDAGDRVVSHHLSTLTGRDGIEVTVRVNYLWRLRDGTITHLVSYRELDDALKAAGLAR
jgi:ketosteroid isomerase-like protein